MSLKVLLADDEPYILEGLSKLIDWEANGYEIVKKASNGQEAYDYLKNNKVDIIFADIQMPKMTGLELLAKIKEEGISDAYFIIVSGFNDFKYAQQAIRYGSMDYLLKPVSKEMLEEILAKASVMKDMELRELRDNAGMKRAYLIQSLMMLLRGKFEDRHLDYISTNLRLSDRIRYIHVSFDSIIELDEYDESELLTLKSRMFDCCRNYLGNNEDHCIKDIPGYEGDYEIGLIYCDYMAKERGYRFTTCILYLSVYSIRITRVKPSAKGRMASATWPMVRRRFISTHGCSRNPSLSAVDTSIISTPNGPRYLSLSFSPIYWHIFSLTSASKPAGI